MIFMYCISATLLAGQFLIADVFNFQLVSPVTNTPLKSTLLSVVDYNSFNAIGTNATSAPRSTFTQFCDTITANSCSQVAWWGNLFFGVFKILTGASGVWDILVFFGVPSVVLALILIPYWILFFRTMLGYAKNFF